MPYSGMEQGPNGETLQAPVGLAASGKVVAAMGPVANGVVPTQWVTPVTDHGGLTGLADDDHPQYAKKAGDTIGGVTLNSGAVQFGTGNADPEITLYGGNVSFQTNAGAWQGVSMGPLYVSGGNITAAGGNTILGANLVLAAGWVNTGIGYAVNGSTVIDTAQAVRLGIYTDLTLPTAGVAGRNLYSSDSGLVHDNGTNWRKASYTNV